MRPASCILCVFLIQNETVIMAPLKLIVCLILLSSAFAFIGNSDSRRCSSLELQMKSTIISQGDVVSRRALLTGMTAAVPAFLISQQAQAKDEIFKANPLTNSVLEQVRFVPLCWRVAAPSDSVFQQAWTLLNRPYA